jgi:succinate dehydrogenase/fumarate reductase flavoprotein subunit
MDKPSPLRPIELKRKLKTVMHDHVHHRRNAEGLEKAIDNLRELRTIDVPRLQACKPHRIYNYEWEEALEAVNMIDLAEMVTASALQRKESRGHHWRTDFPSMRKEWEKHTIVRRKNEHDYELGEAPIIRLKDREKDRRAPDASLIEAGVLEGYLEK